MHHDGKPRLDGWLTCGASIDITALAEDREPLFAEALAAFRAGEAWHLPPDPERQAAQEAAREEHLWEQPIKRILDGLTEGDGFDRKAEGLGDGFGIAHVSQGDVPQTGGSGLRPSRNNGDQRAPFGGGSGSIYRGSGPKGAGTTGRCPARPDQNQNRNCQTE